MFIDCTFCILLNCGIHCVQSSFNSFVWLHCVCPFMFVCMLTCRPWTFVRLCSVSATQLLKHHRPFLLQAMASICLMMADHRPVAIHCDIRCVDALCFRCYNCGGMCCGHCVFQHRRISARIATLQEVQHGQVNANELAEGMHHTLHALFFHPQRASDMAADPAGAASACCRMYLCG